MSGNQTNMVTVWHKPPSFSLLTCLLCSERSLWVSLCRRRLWGLWRSPCSWWWLHAARSRWPSPCHLTWPCSEAPWSRRARCWWYYCCCCFLVTGGSSLSWRIYLMGKGKKRCRFPKFHFQNLTRRQILLYCLSFWLSMEVWFHGGHWLFFRQALYWVCFTIDIIIISRKVIFSL